MNTTLHLIDLNRLREAVRLVVKGFGSQDDEVAAKLILSLAQRMAERLRALGQQLQMLMELAPPPTE